MPFRTDIFGNRTWVSQPKSFENSRVHPRSVHNLNRNPVYPQGGQPSQGAWAQSRYSQQRVVAIYANSSALTSSVWDAAVQTSSARLAVSIAVVPECQTKDVSFSFRRNKVSVAGQGPSGWGAWNAIQNPVTGQRTTLGQVYGESTNRPYGDLFRPTGTESLYLLRGRVQSTDWLASNFTNGTETVVTSADIIQLKVIATWEPQVEISADELSRLFAGCSLQATQAATVNQTPS
jgi:hypothetical protein